MEVGACRARPHPTDPTAKEAAAARAAEQAAAALAQPRGVRAQIN